MYENDMVDARECVCVCVCLKRKGQLIGDGEIHPYRHAFESITKIAQSMNKHVTTCATEKTIEAKKHRLDLLMHEINFYIISVFRFR